MFIFIKEKFFKFENKIKKIMTKGISFSFLITLISSIFLFTYSNIYSQPTIYYIGISLFKTSLFFIMEFIICGLAFDRIKKENM